MNKKSIRKRYMDKRMDFSKEEILEFSVRIKNMFFKNFDLTPVETIHIFLPIKKFNEIDSWQIIDELKKRQNLRITVSQSDLEKFTLKHFLLEDKSELVENSWGIMEPQGGEIIDSSEIDMTIVPLIAFDKKGHRIGYGKGFYDRFLSECREDALKIGLSVFPPVNNIKDTASHDVLLDFCITPEKIYKFTS